MARHATVEGAAPPNALTTRSNRGPAAPDVSDDASPTGLPPSCARVAAGLASADATTAGVQPAPYIVGRPPCQQDGGRLAHPRATPATRRDRPSAAAC